METFEGVSDALSAVTAGRADLAVGPISITAQRAETVDFTQPYFTASAGIMTPTAPSSALTRFKPLLNQVFAIGFALLVVVLFGVGNLIDISCSVVDGCASLLQPPGHGSTLGFPGGCAATPRAPDGHRPSRDHRWGDDRSATPSHPSQHQRRDSHPRAQFRAASTAASFVNTPSSPTHQSRLRMFEHGDGWSDAMAACPTPTPTPIPIPRVSPGRIALWHRAPLPPILDL